MFSQRLYSQLRTIRNLAILTPFQKSTRDRIAAAIPPLGLRIRQDRIHLARLQMYASMLRQDHDREQHEWSQSRHVALQAAAKSLRDPKAVRAVVDDVNANDEPSVPTLSLPDPDEVGDDQVLFGSSPGELPVVMRRSSDEMVRRPTVSRQVSANSFVSFSGSVGPELRWSSSDLLIAIDTTRGRQIDSPLATPGSESSGGHSTSMVLPLSDVDEGAGRNQSTTDDRNGHHSSTDPELMGRRVDKGMNEEIAEDWQKTLAAKRVSLANLPHGDMREVSRRIRGPSEEVDLGSSHDE